MTSKPKLNQPDVESTTTFSVTGESLTINMTIPTEQFKDIFVTGTNVISQQFNPTLSECIKEWEEKGYLCFLSKEQKLLDISNLEEYSVIKIGLENKHYIKVDSVLYSSFVPITFEEHNLITKTLKALEVEK